MQPFSGRSPRERLSQQITNLRAALEQDISGVAVSAASITPEDLDQFASAGGGVLGCILLVITPQEREEGAAALAFDPRRSEQMIWVALQLLAPMIRSSDVLVRLGGHELACLLPGTGPLEARGVGWRLRSAVDSRDFWFEEHRYRMSCRAGLSARGTRGVGDDLRSLVEAARRNPIS